MQKPAALVGSQVFKVQSGDFIKSPAFNFHINNLITIQIMKSEEDIEKRNDEMNHNYASHLEFLWEQYNKLMGLGFIAATATLAFLLQGVVFNKSVRELLNSLPKGEVAVEYLVVAMLFSALSAVCFVISRWCSQILMERQVYGRRDDALKYFEITLDNETILPTALKPKDYTKWLDSRRLLKLAGIFNEGAKWGGIFLSHFLGYQVLYSFGH